MPEDTQELRETVQERTYEEVAMDKIADIHQAGLYLHKTPLENLGSILKEGIIAKDFAEKIGKKDFKRKYSSWWNDKHVSLIPLSGITPFDSDHIGFIIRPTGEIQKIGPNTRSGKIRPFLREFIVTQRIAPREIVGVCISRQKFSEQWSKFFKVEYSVDPQVVVREIKKGKPRFSLPIYDQVGNLIWPKELGYQDIHQLTLNRESTSTDVVV